MSVVGRGPFHGLKAKYYEIEKNLCKYISEKQHFLLWLNWNVSVKSLSIGKSILGMDGEFLGKK
jgi:hypothetical protein